MSAIGKPEFNNSYIQNSPDFSPISEFVSQAAYAFSSLISLPSESYKELEL
jgi:hypothetical protein